MPMFVRTPRNQRVLERFGPYASGLNLLDRKQTAVQRQVRRGGLASYEPETQATLLALVQLSPKPAEFFDVGAHIGIYASLVAAIFPPDLVHVTAFEPTPSTARILQNMAEANHLQIRLESCALSSQEGTATLYISEKAETSNSLVAGFRPSSESVDVPMTTLDAYCVGRGVFPTVMKIDVETFESHVLRGSMGTLADSRPAVVCELLPSAAPTETEEVLHAIEELGYSVHRWSAGDQWEECSIDDIRGHVSGVHRDWLFSPGPLAEEFHAAVEDWRAAIRRCTVEQNLLLPGGSKPPTGWNAPYPLWDRSE